jgi:hypothetical protein
MYVAALQKTYRQAGWISPVVLVNGCMQGTWRYEEKRKTVTVWIKPFADLSGEVTDGIAAEAERLSGFYGLPVKLEYE